MYLFSEEARHVVTVFAAWAIGALAAIIYLYMGWYKRDSRTHYHPQDSKVTFWKALPQRLSEAYKNPKLRPLTMLFGTGGVVIAVLKGMGIGKEYWVCTCCAAFGFSVLGIMCMSVFAGISGVLRRESKGNRAWHGLSFAMRALLEGWEAVSVEAEAATTNLHVDSKFALCHLARDIVGVLGNEQECGAGIDRFRAVFTATTGLVLSSFFQHSHRRKLAHPDYCASFFVLDDDRKALKCICTNGSPGYSVDMNTVLGSDSWAMKSLDVGFPLVWPKCRKQYRLKPSPPVGKSIKEFIVLPIPLGSHVDMDKRLGVFCVDTCIKRALRADDEFHMQVLELLSLTAYEMYRMMVLCNMQRIVDTVMSEG